MELQRAFDNVVAVVRAFCGTAQQHEDLALSLRTIAEELSQEARLRASLTEAQAALVASEARVEAQQAAPVQEMAS